MPLNDIGVGRGLETRSESFTPLLFRLTKFVQQLKRFDGRGQCGGGMFLCSQNQRRFAVRQIPRKNSWGSEVFFAIQSSGSLRLIQKIVIPQRLLRILTIGKGCDRRHTGVRRPRHLVGSDVSVEPKRWIAFVQRMVIAAGKERPYGELHISARTEHLPGDAGHRLAFGRKNLLLDARSVFELEDPVRPRLPAKRLDALRSFSSYHTGWVALRRKLDFSAWRLHPGVQAVDQDEAARGRGCGHQQQGVIAAGADAVRGPGSESPETVGLKPFFGC